MVSRWEEYLKVSAWTSRYASVSRLLSHLKRIGGSEASRALYGSDLYAFCVFVGRRREKGFVSPDELVCLSRDEAGSLLQSFCDEKQESPRYANTRMNGVKTFFRVNGFKGDRELEVEGFSLRGCGRKKPEYIPTLSEAIMMANVAGSLKNRTIILVLLSTGLRNSTLLAILYGEVEEELERGLDNIHIKVHRGMKKIVPNACKDGTEYSIFTCLEATQALRLYRKERIRRFGKIDGSEPLFISEPGRLRGGKRVFKPLTSRELQLIVKQAARRAGIEKWMDVTPHTLRKTFATWVLCAPLIDGSKLDLKTQEVFMGHKLRGSMDAYYDRSKIDDLRREYSKIIFTPRNEGRIEALEPLRVLAEALDIDCIKLIECKKRELGRDLSSEDTLRLLQEAVKQIVRQNNEANKSSKMLSSHELDVKDPTQHAQAISSISSTTTPQIGAYSAIDSKTVKDGTSAREREKQCKPN